MKTGSQTEKKKPVETERKTCAKRARKLPRPTRVTWCPECHKIGIRWNEDQPVDKVCRYCKKGKVRMNKFTSLNKTNRFIENYRRDWSEHEHAQRQ